MEQSQEIPCTVCRNAQPEFEAITQRLNQAKTPAEKTPFARELIQKVGAVLNEHQTSGGILTEACRTLLNLRKQTAELILKFQR